MRKDSYVLQGTRENRLLTILCAALAALLVLSLIPMLAIARYDLPLGDDILYGAPVLRALAGDPSLRTALSAAAGVVAEKYHSWQGTFSAIYLMALQPGVFSLSAYRITPYLMIGSLIASTMLLLYTLLCSFLSLPRRAWLLIGSAVLLFSMQLCASPREAFYWYNGAIYYTFYHALTLVLITLILRIFQARARGARIAYFLLGVLLCAVLSGGNYASAMICGEAIVLAAAYAVKTKRVRVLLPLLVMLAVFAAGLIVSMIAPGNAVRQADVLSAGYAQSGPVKAVLLSLAMGAGFALQWFDVAAIAVIVLVAVFAGPGLLLSGRSFRYPLLVVALTFCVFASQFAPTAYAASSPGPYRLRNVVYFMYLLMIGFDTAYVTGWMQRRFAALGTLEKRSYIGAAFRMAAAYPVAAFACAALLVFAPLVKTLPPTIPSVIAVRELLDGTAERHAENRQNQLNGRTVPETDFVNSELLS